MALPTITEAMADAYFATTPRQAAWAAVVGPDIVLTEAQTWLAALCWDPAIDCCGNNFDAAYTRAVSELALALSLNPTALIGGSAATGGTTGAIKRQKLGDLEVEFHPLTSGSATSGDRFGPKSPLVLQKFPWLWDICGCWILNSGNRQLAYRVRS